MTHKTYNTTGIIETLIGAHTAETVDDKGNRGLGGSWNSQHEANHNSYEDYKSNSDSSSGGGSSGGSSGGDSGGSCCYVTTACLDAMGLPRDSLELRAMKVLTNNHILRSFSGKRDYVTYQRKGPKIVQAIESREDAQSIWRSIYDQLKNVTASILSNNYEEGHQQYKELILGLEKQFC
jgi:hypothetical protein